MSSAVTPKEAPYGTWTSPIDAESLTTAAIVLEGVLVDDVTREIYHIERRPSEAGRSVLVRSQERTDVVDQAWNVRTRVHEYGEGAATVSNGVAYFSNYDDGRLYRVVEGKVPEPVSPENRNWRYADFVVFHASPNLLISVLEDHTKPHHTDVSNKLVVINTVTKTVVTLVEGADFYMSLAISPDGTRLSWIQWHHPDMPWDGSELVIADIVKQPNSLTLENAVVVAGRKRDISVSQPQWTPNGTLVFLNDCSGFVNPWSCSFASGGCIQGPIAVQPIEEDFSNLPRRFGYSDYAILDANNVLFTSTRESRSTFTLANLHSRKFTSVPAPYTVISYIYAITPLKAVFLAKKDDESEGIILVEFSSSGVPSYTKISSAQENPYPREMISTAQSHTLTIPTSNAPIHILFYPPRNPLFFAPAREKPPAIFSIHGGPTSRAPAGLNWTIQYWTTRGWAWVEVNHGGSSGYGRKYRERLRGKWGIVDVNDTVEAVKQLSELGLIDPKRAAIRGGSAGGYTTLACLVAQPKVFAAGTSLFGISDLIKLSEDAHKFESHYLETLIGGPLEDIPDVYRERSPITRADRIETPLLVRFSLGYGSLIELEDGQIMQGSIDAVIPASQAELIVNSVKKAGGRVKYIIFDGEGHGWRKAENIQRALEAELSWYQNIFGLTRPT